MDNWLIVSAAALLTMVMLGLIIWHQWTTQQQLRKQFAHAEEQWQAQRTLAEEQQGSLRDELAHIRQERDDLKVTSPIEVTQCLACRSPLQVVLCPYCHTPYHKERVGPNGKPLHCWEAILQNGRCWNCRQDLTLFQKVPAGATAREARNGAAQPVPPRPAPTPHLEDTGSPAADDGDDFKILS